MATVPEISIRVTANTAAAVQNLNNVATALNNISTHATSSITHITNISRSLTTMGVRARTTQTQLAQIQASMAALAASANGMATALNRSGAALHQAASGSTSLSLGLMATVGAAYGAAQSVHGFAEALISAKEEAFKLNSALTVISGSSAGATDELEYLSATANKLGLNAKQVSQSFLSLRAASEGTTLEGEKTRSIFSAISLAMARLGRSTYDTSRALKAVEQMISKGVVNAEELRQQLGENLPGAYGLAAKAMGLTGKELSVMLMLGKVTAEEMLPRLAVEIKKIYDKGGEIRTLTAEWARFQNTLSDPAPGKGLLVTLNNALGLNDALAAMLRDARVIVAEFNEELKAGQYDKRIIELKALAGAVTGVAAAFIAVAAATSAGALLKMMVTNPFSTIALGAAAAVGALVMLRNETVQFGKVTGTVGDLVKATWAEMEVYWSRMSAWFSNLGNDTPEWMNTVSRHLSDALSHLLSWAKSVINAVIAIFDKGFAAISIVFEHSIMRTGQRIAALTQDIMSGDSDFTNLTALNKQFAAVDKQAGGMLDKIKAIGLDVTDYVGLAITGISDLASSASSAVGKELDALNGRVEKRFADLTAQRKEQELLDARIKELGDNKKATVEAAQASELLKEKERELILTQMELLTSLVALENQMRKTYIGYDGLRKKAVEYAAVNVIPQAAAFDLEKKLGLVNIHNNLVSITSTSDKWLASMRAVGLELSTISQATQATSEVKLNGTAKAFIQQNLQYAREAAKLLGKGDAFAYAALAQSGHETGWGQHLPRRADGSSSYNYFGVKADKSWQGDVASAMTTENRNGRNVRERHNFRAYSSPKDSFLGWGEFLQRNPRYSNALKAETGQDFLSGLAKAKYATDQSYESNVLRVYKTVLKEVNTEQQAATAATTEATAANKQLSSVTTEQMESWNGVAAAREKNKNIAAQMSQQDAAAFMQQKANADQVAQLTFEIERANKAQQAAVPIMATAIAFKHRLENGEKMTAAEVTAGKEAMERAKAVQEGLVATQRNLVVSDDELVASGAQKNRQLALSNDQLEQVSRKYGSSVYAARDYRIEMNNIRQAYAAGALSTEEYAKAQKQVQLEYQKTQGSMAAYFAGLEESIGSIEGFAVDAMEGFRSALVNGLVDGRFEFDDFVKDIKKKLAEIAINTIMVKVVGGGLGLTNMTPSAINPDGKTPASDLSAIATIGKLFSGNSMGTTLARGLTTTAGKFGTTGNWVGSSASNMMQTPNWQYAAGSIGGSLLGNAIFGNKGQGATGSTVGTTLGAIAGSAVPVVGTMLGGLIGGALGGAIGSLFGDDKPRQGNYSTSFSGTGFEDDAKAAGAFGLSFGLADKGSQNIAGADYQETFDAMAELSKTISSFYGATLANDVQAALNARLGDFNAWGKDLDTSFKTMFTAIIDAADAAENSVGQGMGHLLKVAVGTLEGDANEAATQIANAIVTVNTAIAMFDTETGRLLGMGTGLEFDTVEKSVLGIKQFVVEFARSGEEYADTANRILSSANIFTQAFALSGRALDSVTLSGTEFVAVATQFNDAMASYDFTFDKLSAAQNSYYEAFFTEEERAIKTRDTSLKSIAAWSASIGQAQIDTSAEFRTYVESLDLLDEAQQQAYLRAMQLVPVFTALDDALETLKTTANEFVLSLRSDDRIQSDALLEMVTLFDSWNLTLPETSDALYLMIQAGQLTSAQIKTLEEDSSDLASAFEALEREMFDLPEFIKSLTPDISVNESALLRIESFFEAWNIQLPQTEAALYELIRAGGLTTEQITLLAKNADDLTAAFAALNVVPDFINSLTTEAASGYSALSAITNLFAEWNIAMPQTEAALYELIRAGAFTEEQMKLLANNADLLSGAFSTLNGEMEFVSSLQNEAASNESALAGLVNLFAEWGVQLPSSSDALYHLIIAGELTQEQMRVLAANTELVGNAFDALSTRQSNAVALLQDAYDAGVQNLNDLAEARIQGYRDSADADQDALKTAYDARIDSLTKANELIVDGLNDSIDKLKDSVDIFKDVIDSTKSALTALADASDGAGETRQRYLAQARSAVTQYNNGGTLPENITDIIQGLSSVDQQDYATLSDWKAAVGENEAVLTQIQKIGVAGKSESEQQIELLEQQILNEDENFESLKNLAEKQYNREMYLIEKNLDALIDNENASRDKSIAALTSEFELMKETLMTDTNTILNTTNGILSNMLTTLGTAGASALAAALSANGKATEARNPIANGGVTVPVGTTPIASAVAPVTNKYTTPDISKVTNPTGNAANTNTPATIKPVAETIIPAEIVTPIAAAPITKNPKTEWNEALYLTKNVDVLQAVRNKLFPSGLEHFLTNGFYENKDGKHREGTGLDYVYQFNEAKYLARNTDVADAIANGIINSALEHYVRFGAPEGRSPIGAFANGGYHSGGLRWVGEKGPELEYTPPSHITSNNNISSLLSSGNSDVVAELKELRREVKELKASSAAQATNGAAILKIHKKWDGAGLPPDRMDYAKTTAENTEPVAP